MGWKTRQNTTAPERYKYLYTSWSWMVHPNNTRTKSWYHCTKKPLSAFKYYFIFQGNTCKSDANTNTITHISWFLSKVVLLAICLGRRMSWPVAIFESMKHIGRVRICPCETPGQNHGWLSADIILPHIKMNSIDTCTTYYYCCCKHTYFAYLDLPPTTGANMRIHQKTFFELVGLPAHRPSENGAWGLVHLKEPPAGSVFWIG